MKLQEDELIASPQLRHRSTPGRPQHVYTLTEQAIGQFPNNYQRLASTLLRGIREHVPADGINVILEDVADSMASRADIPQVSMTQRLDMVVDFLNEQGYEAHWEPDGDEFLLLTSNCPYHQLASEDHMLCEMDMHLIARLLGVVPRRTAHVMAGDAACAYRVPNPHGND
jgi:predicted ArsR family transcriptional regulator